MMIDSISADGRTMEGSLYMCKQNLIRGVSWKKQYFRLDMEANTLYQYDTDSRPLVGVEPNSRLVTSCFFDELLFETTVRNLHFFFPHFDSRIFLIVL